MKPELTLARLRELLHYEPETGVFTWRVDRTAGVKAGDVAGRGNVNSSGYQRIRVQKRLYPAHRLAWFYMTGSWPEHEIDHRNGKRADNRWGNLRDVDDATNCQNTHGVRRDNQVGLSGVGKKANGRFYARIRTNGRLQHLGRFDTAQEAHDAYLAAKRQQHAGFAG